MEKNYKPIYSKVPLKAIPPAHIITIIAAGGLLYRAVEPPQRVPSRCDEAGNLSIKNHLNQTDMEIVVE